MALNTPSRSVLHPVLAATEKGLDTDGNLECEKFYGNTCHQIYFKPQGELRDQCYLVYDKAWVEKELVPNKWYTIWLTGMRQRQKRDWNRII
jgi:hypothetical protein